MALMGDTKGINGEENHSIYGKYFEDENFQYNHDK